MDCRSGTRNKERTIRVPHPGPDELHSRRAQGVVLGELELGCEYTTFEWGFFGPLDQGFPVEHVILRDRASCDAFWWVRGEVLVFVEQAFLGDGGSHFVRRRGGRVYRR